MYLFDIEPKRKRTRRKQRQKPKQMDMVGVKEGFQGPLIAEDLDEESLPLFKAKRESDRAKEVRKGQRALVYEEADITFDK